MDTWDNTQPDRDLPMDAASATPAEGSESGAGVDSGLDSGADSAMDSGAAGPRAGANSRTDPDAPPEVELPDLRRALATIADHYSAAPQPDLFPQVMKRATRIRQRRRAIRAGSATAVLVVAALLGPSMASELGMRGGRASAAPPPSAIVDLTSAYPMPQPEQDDAAMAMPTQPENALAWPSRGATVPTQAVDVAKSYLLQHVKSPATTTATVTTLWAQVDEDAQAASQQKAHKTWLYVMQGWTSGPDGSPSPAQLMVGDYTQAGKASSMSVYATPVKFAHVRPGSADDADDARQIAELSLWLPQSDRLVVLGAPQTETVLYAKTGGDLIPQKTIDGVAVFPRTRELVKGRYADTIQVRDAKNVALTPPKAWSAGDFALSGAMSLWSSATARWMMVPARPGKLAPGTGLGGESPVPTPRVKPTVPGTAQPSAAPPSAFSPAASTSGAPPPADAGTSSGAG